MHYSRYNGSAAIGRASIHEQVGVPVQKKNTVMKLFFTVRHFWSSCKQKVSKTGGTHIDQTTKARMDDTSLHCLRRTTFSDTKTEHCLYAKKKVNSGFLRHGKFCTCTHA